MTEKLYDSLLSLSHTNNKELSRTFLKKKLNVKKERSKYMVFEPDFMWQCDVKYLPRGLSAYNFLLVCVDASTRLCDAQPMKTLNQQSCIKAFQTMLNRHIISDKNPILVVTDNGAEFKTEFTTFLNDLGIKHRTIQPGRKEQVSIVEHINELIAYALGTHAYKLMTQPIGRKPLQDYEINYLANNILPRTIETINNFMKTKYPLNPDEWFKIDIDNNFDQKFDVGDVVYVKNFANINNKIKYRNGQHKFLDLPYRVTRVFFPVLKGQPVRYMTTFSDKMTFKADEMVKQSDHDIEHKTVTF